MSNDKVLVDRKQLLSILVELEHIQKEIKKMKEKSEKRSVVHASK